MIAKRGGVPFVSPSMREVPLERNQAAIDFANRLITGRIDVIIFLTGVGTRILVAADRAARRSRAVSGGGERHQVGRPRARSRWPCCENWASRRRSPCRSRTPGASCWPRSTRSCPWRIWSSGLQEYGVTNRSLIAGLEARGATVDAVHVYDWALPEDCGPLEQNIRRIAAGEIDVAMFTSANQVLNLLKLADELGLADDLRAGLRNVVVASIGPTTSEMLRNEELPVDLEPSHPKMGHLVDGSGGAGGGNSGAKATDREQTVDFGLRIADCGLRTNPQSAIRNPKSALACTTARSCAPAAASRPTSRPSGSCGKPGRYMPEYRRIREQHSFLELCSNPQLCSEIMCTAVERLGVDAAIIFSDLLPILEPMGMELEFAHGEGPLIHNPVREPADVDRVVELESADALHFVMETVRQTRADLPAHIPLIGFAGAPFTLASYAIEGGGEPQLSAHQDADVPRPRRPGTR